MWWIISQSEAFDKMIGGAKEDVDQVAAMINSLLDITESDWQGEKMPPGDLTMWKVAANKMSHKVYKREIVKGNKMSGKVRDRWVGVIG